MKPVHGALVGGARPPEYEVWRMMRRRCEDPSRPDYDRYGGRGIRVCERWRSFGSFLADMGRRPSRLHQVDRIDNDGPYAPENCRWATVAEQRRNSSVTRFIEAGGERLCVEDWARRLGLHQSAIHHRLARGWSETEAVTVPKRGVRQ